MNDITCPITFLNYEVKFDENALPIMLPYYYTISNGNYDDNLLFELRLNYLEYNFRNLVNYILLVFSGNFKDMIILKYIEIYIRELDLYDLRRILKETLSSENSSQKLANYLFSYFMNIYDKFALNTVSALSFTFKANCIVVYNELYKLVNDEYPNKESLPNIEDQYQYSVTIMRNMIGTYCDFIYKSCLSISEEVVSMNNIKEKKIDDISLLIDKIINE